MKGSVGFLKQNVKGVNPHDWVGYCPISGSLYSRVDNSNVKKGQRLKGALDYKGYLRYGVGGLLLRGHRLAFLLQDIDLPKQVDHINRERSDNRWVNLRPANNQTNQFNTGKRCDNTSGFKNVYYRKSRNTWIVKVATINGLKYIGTFKDIEEANIKAISARLKYQNYNIIEMKEIH